MISNSEPSLTDQELIARLRVSILRQRVPPSLPERIRQRLEEPFSARRVAFPAFASGPGPKPESVSRPPADADN